MVEIIFGSSNSSQIAICAIGNDTLYIAPQDIKAFKELLLVMNDDRFCLPDLLEICDANIELHNL